MGTKPLSGVRVLDLTNVLSGPYCCYQLSLMGAEVIKVERPGSGDLARQLGANPTLSARNMGISFLAQNAGKKSVTLNLKHPEGTKILKQLAAASDVLVENFRPGVTARLGLGYDDLKPTCPELIYCAISGFGQDGPMADDPAYDQIIQGISGLMSITGDQGSAPLRVGYPVADTVGGMTAAFAIAAALNAKPRGTFLDISMTEAVLSGMGWVVSDYLIGGKLPEPQGNENVTSAPSGSFDAKDRKINIAANKDQQWRALARHLGLEGLIEQAAYRNREQRKANRIQLKTALEAVLKTRPAADWAHELSGLGVPCAVIQSVPEALHSGQITGRQLTQTHQAADQTIDTVAAPVVVDGDRPKALQPPPELGQDNRAVYAQLGYDAAKLQALAAQGVI